MEVTVAESVVLIPLAQVVVSSTNPRKTITDKEIKEMTESIKAVGVRSPIKVRVVDEKYEIIYGERRYRGSVEAGVETIPAMIVEMSNEDVEKEQFIENMVRQDVHPMDEGVKFLEMMSRTDENALSSADVAAMINRTEGYVLQRIQLNNLIPALQKDFWKNKFNIAMAIEFCRLTHKQQKEARERIMSQGEYGNLKQLKEYIRRYMLNDLNNAPFDTTDVNLNPKMGACTTCNQRSGANKLFEDIKDKNICFNDECFKLKSITSLLVKIDEAIAKYPDMLFIKDYRDLTPVIEKKLKSEKVEIVEMGYNSWSTYKSTGDISAKAMYVNGENSGKIITIYKTGTKKKKDVKELVAKGASNNVLIAEIDSQISSIKERQKRSLELDAEKVWMRIHAEILPEIDTKSNGKFTKPETAALLYSLYSTLKYSGSFGKYPFLAVFEGVNFEDMYNGVNQKMLDAFAEATSQQIHQCFAIFILNNLNTATGSHTANTPNAALKAFADQTKKAEIDTFTVEQEAAAEKRIANAKLKIEALQNQKKELQAKEKKPVKKLLKSRE